MGPWVHVPAPVSLAGVTLRRGALHCFPELPPGIMLQRPQGNCEVMSPSLAFFPSLLLSLTPLPVLPATTSHRNNLQVALEEANKVGEDRTSSRHGKPGCRNGLAQGSKDAQPPTLLFGSVLFFPAAPRLTSSQSQPGEGRGQSPDNSKSWREPSLPSPRCPHLSCVPPLKQYGWPGR